MKEYSSYYKEFVLSSAVRNEKKNERKEKKISGSIKVLEKKKLIKLNACKLSLRELLNSLKNLEKSFKTILNYFEDIKKEIYLGSSYYIKKIDQTMLLNIFQKEIYITCKESIDLFKKKLPFFFLKTLKKILKYLNILHSNEYCHLDLKPENIVLNSFEDAFLIDLESVRPAINIIKNAELIATEKYADPEILSESTVVIPDGRRCDSFSLSKIIEDIILLLDELNYDGKDNHAIIFLNKLKELLMKKRTPIIKVINLIKIFQLNHMNYFEKKCFGFDNSFILNMLVKNCKPINNSSQCFIKDYSKIVKKKNNYLDQIHFFNENAYLSIMSVNNNEIYNNFFNQLLDIKIYLNEYPVFFFYVYFQKNITLPRMFQILGLHYFYLNRYSYACCLLRNSLKIYEREMEKSGTKKNELFFENLIMLAISYILKEDIKNYERIKKKIIKYLKINKFKDYRLKLVLSYDEEKKGNWQRRKELLIESLDQLIERDPYNRNIANIIYSISEIGEKKELEKYSHHLEKFKDPISLLTIYEMKMKKEYNNFKEEKAELYFRELKKIQNILGVRKYHPRNLYYNFLKLSMIIKFKDIKHKNQNYYLLLQENNEIYEFQPNYRLEDRIREYNLRIKFLMDSNDNNIWSIIEMTKTYLKSIKNHALIGYTYLQLACFLRNKGNYPDSIQNFEKSREYYCKKYGENHDFTIWTDTLKAETLLLFGDYSQAWNVIQNPYTEYSKIENKDHCRLKKTIEIYEKIAKEIKNYLGDRFLMIN